MSELTIASESFEIVIADEIKVKGRVKSVVDGLHKPAVVVAHGFRGTQDWGFWPEVLERLAQSGYYAISFNYSRIAVQEEGIDEQRVAEASTISQDLKDIGAVINHLKQGLLPLSNEVNAENIAFLGHSRSGGSGIIYASEHPTNIQNLIVWNGGASPISASTDPNLSPIQLAVALDKEANENRFNVTDQFIDLKQPVLIVQGDSDSERLLSFVAKLKELAPHQSYVSIPEANHTFGVAHPYEGATEHLRIALEETISFLDIHLKTK
ncbi:dienelactone hydrolase family protein [Paenibacillus sp. GSMTC-2017]|uniref:alpha/beta hydrolase family protein n=1 Tax=Paenibacillus sp. GSMTC-2017 TaxID=2794350 RepID=UPI0018D9B452|nr:dienelactone hydrolase family protein [Paenibacillus sp. GSMTC-2017]MBH5317436.1 dienelactone hydrolase family protein [Paenibacillus sp. GSMTC-2017]